MIDLHCHVLSGIDDGPETEEGSIVMLKEAVKEGIDTIVVTPHKNPTYQPSLEDIIRKRNELQDLANKNNLPIILRLGQEVRVYGELLDDYLDKKIFSVNSVSGYILVEFDSDDIPQYSKNLFYNMQCKGLIPIIVHPERNSQILKNPEILYQFIQGGALAQVTASSITGHFGKKIQKFTYQLLEANLAHFVASDAHDVGHRNFRMKQAFEKLAHKYGNEYTAYLNENSNSVLLNNKIFVQEPLKIQRSKFGWIKHT